MIGSRILRRYTPVSTLRLAVMLLCVLLAHLAFMSSPLHAAALKGSAVAPAVPVAGAPAQVEPGHADDGRDGHCRMQWATPPQRLAVDPLGAAAPVGWIGERCLELAGAYLEVPTAHALSPPSRGDPQALLQVFRL